MKIKLEHYEYMHKAIAVVLENNPTAVAEYESGNFPRADKVKDLQKRFCYDLVRAAKIHPWIVDNVYTYCDDSHVYTALKSMCPKIVRKYLNDN